MNTTLKARDRWLGAGFVALGVLSAGAFALIAPAWDVRSTDAEENLAQTGAAALPGMGASLRAADVTGVPTPEPLFAVYMSQCVVGTPDFRERLVSMIEKTQLNAVVIDVKDYSGTIGFPTEDPRFGEVTLTNCGAHDMRAFLASLHEKGIYTIARVTVFQDPAYTKRFPDQAVQSIARPGEPWHDYKGLSYVDVSSRPFWDYIVSLSKEAYAVGFDELNYDYIRYPSDGPISDARYVNDNKAEALEMFFRYLNEQMHGTGAILSADLFGYTTVLSDDLGIGQQLERTLPYFDYVAPMVYPSHYNKGFAGLANPNSDPYKVVFTSMKEAVRRALATETAVETLDGKPVFKDETVPAHADEDGTLIATTTRKVATGHYTKPVYDKQKLRPWLQDFDYGKDYTVADIAGQIQAVKDAGLTSWTFWDPANRYDSLKTYLTAFAN